MASTIIIGARPEQEVSYLNLARPSSPLTFRTVAYDKNDPTILRWAREGKSICYTVASSDFVSWQKRPVYVPAADAVEVLGRPKVTSVYLHEVVANYAARNAWNWLAAVDAIDWRTLDQIAKEAMRLRKKVIWSEPAHGWDMLMKNATAKGYLASWKTAVVPTFATNFPTFLGKNLAEARWAALALATTMGASIQSWYFRDQGQAPTVQETQNLCSLARSATATVYQIEGDHDDLAWGSAYMNGVWNFTRTL